MILLDEVVVRVFRECQGAQIQRVDGGKAEQLEATRVFREEFQIVFDNVVPNEVCGPVGEFVERGNCRLQCFAVSAPDKGIGSIGADRADRTNVLASLKVDR